MKVTQHSETIWTIDNFLSDNECHRLIELSENIGYEEATVNASGKQIMLKSARNNSRILYDDKALADDYWQRLQKYCPMFDTSKPIGLNERFRFYKYTPRQRFKRHKDGSYKRNKSEQSRVTFLVYLNDDYTGGETRFDDVTIQPKMGSALCFVHEQWHEGCAVTDGVKYALRSDVMYSNSGRKI